MRDFLSFQDAQSVSDNFSIVTDRDGGLNLISEKIGIVMQIRNGGYIPKSGLLIAEQLLKLRINGKALDIGTGETGILANCLLSLGASHVSASDIDPMAIQWAKQASIMSSGIAWHNCDLFPLSNNYYDIIVSNPPQMPMPYTGHSHDYGGLDGRDLIVKIIEKSKSLLTSDGKLILLCFDFLGIDQSGNQATIIDIAKGNGFKTNVLSRHLRLIRRGGKTEANINWIKKMYPWYLFQRDNQGNYYHEVYILEMNRIIHPRI